MSRLIQIIQNSFIRIEAFLSIFFQFLANLFGNLFGFFGRLFGFSNSGYFLGSDEAQGINKASEPETMEVKPNNTSKIIETPVNTTRRRPNVKQDDYFLNMARDVKKN